MQEKEEKRRRNKEKGGKKRKNKIPVKRKKRAAEWERRGMGRNMKPVKRRNMKEKEKTECGLLFRRTFEKFFS